MDVSRFARTVTMGTVTAVIVALAGLGGASPAAAATPTDDVGLMQAGGFAEFDVLANDGAGPDWSVELVDGSDPRISSFGSSIDVSLFDDPGFTGQLTIPYQLFDENFSLAEMCREMMVLTRRADQRRRIALDLPFLTQVFPECADGGELSCGGRSRVATLVQIAEERADVGVHEVFWRRSGRLLPRWAARNDRNCETSLS